MKPAQLPLDWPLQSVSDTVQAGGLAWHVQRVGTGPCLLLIHGTAASTHSFRALADVLASRFELVLVDLPGHGFSAALDAPTLPRVAAALGALMGQLGVSPDLVAGHSAGAAIAIRMVLDDWIAPRAVIGLSPALKPYGGAADGIASQLARLVFINPLAAHVFSASASASRVRRLIERTGSTLDATGTHYYARLLKRPSHVKGALSMMAHWNLRPLLSDLTHLNTPLTLVVGENDRATPPEDVEPLVRLIRQDMVIRLSGAGHLAHEEDPGTVADLIHKCANDTGLFEHTDPPAARLQAVR